MLRRLIVPCLLFLAVICGCDGGDGGSATPFDSIVEGAKQSPVLVKYSPAGDDLVARRIASLLVAEHLALETLSDAGIPVARSSLIHAAGRVFLESERFDRDRRRYRHGTCSLDVLDGEFLGSDRTSWYEASSRLADKGIVPTDSIPRIHLVERFGQLIGNTDRHFGNLSFFIDGTKVTGLAPIYDMLPVHYAPRGGELQVSMHPFPLPSPAWGDVAEEALDLADVFWRRIQNSDGVDEGLQRAAAESIQELQRLRAAFIHLPQ